MTTPLTGPPATLPAPLPVAGHPGRVPARWSLPVSAIAAAQAVSARQSRHCLLTSNSTGQRTERATPALTRAGVRPSLTSRGDRSHARLGSVPHAQPQRGSVTCRPATSPASPPNAAASRQQPPGLAGATARDSRGFTTRGFSGQAPRRAFAVGEGAPHLSPARRITAPTVLPAPAASSCSVRCPPCSASSPSTSSRPRPDSLFAVTGRRTGRPEPSS